MDEKICVTCHQSLPATTEYFETDSRSRGGVKTECRSCRESKKPKAKVCKKCGVEYPLTSEYFHPQKYCAWQFRPHCRKCENTRLQDYQDKKLKEVGIFWTSDQRKRLKAIEHYSNGTNACACCGEKEPLFLAFDHINGGGSWHRKNEKIGNFGAYLFNRGFPAGYRILCHNCNSAYGFYGFCPHENLTGEQIIERRTKKHKVMPGRWKDRVHPQHMETPIVPDLERKEA